MSLLVPIGEVAEVNPTIPRTLSYSPHTTVTFLPMVAVSEEGRIIAPEESSIGTVIKGYRYFEQGDVLLAKITPCMENGKAAFVEKIPHKIGFGSTEFHVLRPSSGVDGRYLFYMVWNPIFRHIAERNMTGTAGQRRVPTDFVKRYKIPLPPLEEQRRIAAILDKADAVRRKRQEAIRLTEELLRSLFLEMFGDPVTNPKGWKSHKLVDLTSKIGSGSTPRGGEASYKSTGIPLIRSMNVYDYSFEYNGLAYIDEVQAKALNHVIVNNNDILLNITGASVTRCTIVPSLLTPARVNQHVAIIRTKFHLLEPSYLLNLINSASFKKKLLSIGRSKGATREALTKDELQNLLIPVPPIHLQEKFSSIANKLMSCGEQFLKMEQESDNLFNSLLQRAFRGEL